MQAVVHHTRAVADPAGHALLDAVAEVGLERLVRQIVVVSAEACRQLHEAAARQEDGVVADAQHLHLLGQVMVLRQVVGQRRRVHLVGIQREGHRRQRKMMHGKRGAALRDGRLDPRRIPMDGVPAAGDVGAVTDKQRDKTVGIAVHGVRLRIDRRTVFTVGEFNGHRQVGVVHQLIRSVTYHGLIADFVVVVLGGNTRTGEQHQEKNIKLSHLYYFSLLLSMLVISHTSDRIRVVGGERRGYRGVAVVFDRDSERAAGRADRPVARHRAQALVLGN